jgi:hypothetical protein
MTERFLLLTSHQIQRKRQKVAFMRYLLPVASSIASLFVGQSRVVKIIHQLCSDNPAPLQLGADDCYTQIEGFLFHWRLYLRPVLLLLKVLPQRRCERTDLRFGERQPCGTYFCGEQLQDTLVQLGIGFDNLLKVVPGHESDL